MRRVLQLAALLALLVAAAWVAVAATAGGAPVWSGSLQDATGDAGSGPDLTRLAVTVNADDSITISATVIGNGITSDQSLQFFIADPHSSAEVNVAVFEDGWSPATLNTWTGTDWETYHDVDGKWSGGTFTATIPLGDLQNAMQVPVRQGLWVSAKSYTGAVPGQPPVQVDAVPDTGYLPVQSGPSAPPTSTAATTTAAPPAPTTATTSRVKGPTLPVPGWLERIVRLPHARIEWKRLVLIRVPAGATVTLRCTKGCSRSESPRVVQGTATSKRFVGVPFHHGQVFLTKVMERSGAGWWWRTTIVAKPGGQELATQDGCYLSNGKSLPFAKC